MTHQDLIVALAKRLEWTQEDTSSTLDATMSIINANLEAGKSINIYDFGLFETEKKDERISVNPESNERFLVPPKIVLTFQAGQAIKNNLKKIQIDE